MSKASVLEEIRREVAKSKTEATDRSKVAKVLAKYGWVGMPKVLASKDSQGATVRIYHFEDTPAGDFVLISGPSIEGQIASMAELNKAKAEPGFYVEAMPATAPAVRETKKAVKAAVQAVEKEEEKEERKPGRVVPSGYPVSQVTSLGWGAAKKKPVEVESLTLTFVEGWTWLDERLPITVHSKGAGDLLYRELAKLRAADKGEDARGYWKSDLSIKMSDGNYVQYRIDVEADWSRYERPLSNDIRVRAENKEARERHERMAEKGDANWSKMAKGLLAIQRFSQRYIDAPYEPATPDEVARIMALVTPPRATGRQASLAAHESRMATAGKHRGQRKPAQQATDDWSDDEFRRMLASTTGQPIYVDTYGSSHKPQKPASTRPLVMPARTLPGVGPERNVRDAHYRVSAKNTSADGMREEWGAQQKNSVGDWVWLADVPTITVDPYTTTLDSIEKRFFGDDAKPIVEEVEDDAAMMAMMSKLLEQAVSNAIKQAR